MAVHHADVAGTHERRREQLLQAAEELVAVHGFDALRLRDVASHAGVSIGMIQHHFTTRDELLRETMRRASETRVEEWAKLAEGHTSPRAQLRALLTGAVRDVHRCRVWIETCAASTRHEELLADVQRTQEIWKGTLRSAVEAGTARGEFSPRLPTAELAGLLVKLIDGSSLSVATDTRGESALSSAQEQLIAVSEALLDAG